MSVWNQNIDVEYLLYKAHKIKHWCVEFKHKGAIYNEHHFLWVDLKTSVHN
jgi:hypothetical protein